MTEKLGIGRIGYINVDPVYYGFEKGSLKDKYRIVADHPAVLNRMLADKELMISSVSAAAYAENQDNWLILPDLSVSCFADVMSVIFVSKVPIENLAGSKVIISEESKTASDLIELFFRSSGIIPNFVRKKITSYRDIDIDEEAALIIGDAALSGGWDKYFEYVWDLGGLWNNMIELPFVFALWAVNKRFAETEKETVYQVIEDFRVSKEEGKKNIDSIIISGAKKLDIPSSVCKRYFEKLAFGLDDKRIAGLEFFFGKLFEYNIIDRRVDLNFFG